MVSTFIVAGIFAIIVMESLPLLMQRRFCRPQASVVALVTCCHAGVVALVMMVLLQSMCRRICRCYDGY
jgi:hypothetical protein